MFSFLLTSVRKDLARWRQDKTALLIWLGIPFLIGGLITSMIDGGDGTPTGTLLIADQDDSLLSGFVVGAYSQDHPLKFPFRLLMPAAVLYRRHPQPVRGMRLS